ncbi:MAG: CRTAC1 family protein [Planctomycetota bacterium]
MKAPSVLLLGTLPLVACGGSDPGADPGPQAAPAPWFTEQAVARGIDFVHRSGAADERLMPEIMCGGAGLFDADGDGDLDAYLVQADGVRRPAPERAANQLYENAGEGRFRNVTEGSGADDRGYGNGVACGDVDGDGRVDLYVTNVGANALLRNRGDLRFERLASGAEDEGWGTSAAFFDADRDGDLDLYVCNYLVWSADNELPCVNLQGAPDYCSPITYESPAPDRLFLNDGGAGFTDVSIPAGTFAVGNGLGVGILDVDQDGALDVFVANDGMPDRLWRNEGVREGIPRFQDAAQALGLAVDGDGIAKAGMGVAIADLDGDGGEDLLVGNLARESDSIFLNRSGRFADSTRRLGMGASSKPFTRFGLGFHDFDRDGALDLFQANGRVQLGDTRLADPFAEEDMLFRGLPDGGFEAVVPRGGTRATLRATGRAAAFGDVDGDGAIDVLVLNRDAPVQLLIGRAQAVGGWVGIDPRNAAGAPDLHAVVELETTRGTRVARARAAYSYQASNDPRVHFGLAPGEEVRRVTLRWGDGTSKAIDFLKAGGWRVVRR